MSAQRAPEGGTVMAVGQEQRREVGIGQHVQKGSLRQALAHVTAKQLGVVGALLAAATTHHV